MEYILILKGNNKELAIYEFETLFEVYFNRKIELKPVENIFYSFEVDCEIDFPEEFLNRLTYTNSIIKCYGFYETYELYSKNLPNLKEFDGKTFLARLKKSKKIIAATYEERLLAKPIWDSFSNPKVSIDNPQVEFNFIFTSKKGFYFGLKLYQNDRDYLRRMPKQRPIVMPYTLKSDMARAAINLLGLKEGIILDPFCGIGGILLEAKDMKFEIIGNDISYNDLKYFKTNFEHYFPDSKYERILADSKTQYLKDNTVDGIVSDIPYGKCSRKLGSDLYENFLINAKQMLKPNRKMVIIYANFCEFRELALKYFTEIVEIKEYINASMTRYILVLRNDRE